MYNARKSISTAESQEFLAEGWRLVQESMAFVGKPIPDFLEFQIDGARHIRATRVSELDELAKAIAAIEEDIGRSARGESPSIFEGANIEGLQQQKAALIELQKRTSRSGCPGSTTVIEALYPDIPVKKRSASEKAEAVRWLAVRKEAGLKIDPQTAEVDWDYRQTLDPYGVLDEWELPEEFHQTGCEYFARSPGSDVWVHFGDLPDTVRDELRPEWMPDLTACATLPWLSRT